MAVSLPPLAHVICCFWSMHLTYDATRPLYPYAFVARRPAVHSNASGMHQ